MIAIYRITSPSGNVYIGQSRDVKRRFSDYRGGKKTIIKQTLLYRSFLKYGIQSHLFEIIHEFPKDVMQHEIDEQERSFILKHKAEGVTMLNIREGGEGGGLHSQKTKDLIREKRKYQITTDETRKKMSETRKRMGCVLTDESKRRISFANSGIKNGAYGKKITEEQKAKMRAGYKPPPKGDRNPLFGRKLSEERKSKMKGVNGIWMTGKKLSQETCKRIAISQSIAISQFAISGEHIRDWQSAVEAANYLSKTSAHISATCKGTRKTAYGFIWKYKPDTK